MKDNMYTLLNDMDIQVESYEVSEVSSDEMKRWKKVFRQNKQVKRKRYVGRYVAVAALVLVCTLALGPFRRETYAQIKTITYSVQQMLGIETDLSTYETLIGKTIAKNGVIITVNDVVMDRNEMVVSYTLTAENFDENKGCFLDIQVNGKDVTGGSSGTGWMEDDNNMVYLENHYMDDVDINKENYYKLIFYIYETDSGPIMSNERRVGAVEFAASGEQLREDTTTISVDKSYEFPNGDKIRFTELSCNIMGPKLFCESENGSLNYNLHLKGTDNLGNEMLFYLRNFDSEGESWFVLEDSTGYNFCKEARSLTLQIYAAEHPEDDEELIDDYQKVGEPFTIELE